MVAFAGKITGAIVERLRVSLVSIPLKAYTAATSGLLRLYFVSTAAHRESRRRPIA